MKFNKKVLSYIENELRNEFQKYITNSEVLIQRINTKTKDSTEKINHMLDFLNHEIKNINTISKNILLFIQESKVNEIILDEDKNDVNLIFKGCHEYRLENAKKETIVDLQFDGSYIDVINDISKFNFKYRTFNHIPNQKRNASLFEIYKNKRNLVLEENVERSIRIIKSFYNALDLGMFSGDVSYSYETNARDKKVPHININKNPKIFSHTLYENQTPREYFYENFGHYFKNIKNFQEFECFMKFKKTLDTYLNSNNVKTNGLQTSSEVMTWALNDNNSENIKMQKVMFYYELDTHYVKVNDKCNGSIINFFVKLEKYDIQEFSENFIYLETNKKTDYKFKDYLRNKKEVLEYIQLINY